MKQIKIITPQFERSKKESINTPPASPEEYYNSLQTADWGTLKKCGFRKWDSLKNVIEENVLRKEDSKMISIPTYNISEGLKAISGEDVTPSGSLLIDLSNGHERPLTEEGEDFDIILFPGEWYNSIPDGFVVVGLFGEKYPFQKGVSDDDIRSGCLPYGILRKQ